MTSDGLRTFSYDASNRLTQVQVGDADEASKVTYLHNAAGQRVFKSEPQVAQTVPTEEQLGTDFITWLKKNFGWLFAQAQQNATLGQSYVYADPSTGSGQVGLQSYNLLGEYGNGGTKSAGRLEYIYLPTEAGTAQGNAILIGLYKNNRFYAVHTDHLGTPRSITDDTNKVVWQWAYSAFGDNKPTGILKATTNPKAAITNSPKLLQASSPSFAVNLRFPGQYWDDESKLSYNYFRSYRPAQGRYDQADPIGLAGGWNRFGYVEGNPLSMTDPLGLMGQGSGANGPYVPQPGGGVFDWGGPATGKGWRAPTDGAKYGWWGGKNWSGGTTGDKSPVDSSDTCYMKHDKCYSTCAGLPAPNLPPAYGKYSPYKACMRKCDLDLVLDLKGLPADPRQWSSPPAKGMEDAADRMRGAAILYFD